MVAGEGPAPRPTREEIARSIKDRGTGDVQRCACEYRYRGGKDRFGMPTRIGPFLTVVAPDCPIHRPDGPGTIPRSFCCGEDLLPQAVHGYDYQTWYCQKCAWTQTPPFKMLTGRMPRGES